ncbi:MAG: hypothetical protein ABSG45_05845 [Nitrososphaerales archaeon]
MSQRTVYELLKELGGRATSRQISELALKKYPAARSTPTSATGCASSGTGGTSRRTRTGLGKSGHSAAPPPEATTVVDCTEECPQQEAINRWG